MAQVFPPNLAGYHHPGLDLWHDLWHRTQTAPRLPLPTTPEELASAQHTIRERLLTSIGGLMPRPEGFDAAATVQPGQVVSLKPGAPDSDNPGAGSHSAVTAQTLIFESAPQVRVPAVLYRPAAEAEPGSPPQGALPQQGALPAVVFLCGHSAAGKNAPAYQAACVALAQAGFLVLSFDPFGQGERHSYLDDSGAAQVTWGTAEHSYAGIPSWWQGASSVRYFLNDAQAAIEVLINYAGADPSRIGATGNSGGGMLTSLLMALDPRVAAAAPGTFLTTRSHYLHAGAHQDAEQILLGATAAGLDHESLVVATAPRPVCILAASWDFFPIEGTRELYDRMRPVYQLAGTPDALELVEVAAPHTYHPEHIRAAIRFFRKHLGGSQPAALPSRELPTAALPPETLQATASGQIAIDAPDTWFISELTRLNAQAVASTRRREDAVAARIWLREQARGGVREFPAGPAPLWGQGGSGAGDSADTVTVRKLPVSSSHSFIAWPQPTTAGAPIWNSGIIPFGELEPVREFATFVLLDEGTNDFATWAQEKNKLDLQRAGVLVLDVRGRGPLTPFAYKETDQNLHSSSTYKLLTDLLWLGDSLAAGQLYDVLSAIYRWGTASVRIAGVGYGAYLARLAAFVEPRITTLHLDDEYVDPVRMTTDRLWDEGRGAWHGVIPGLSKNAPWEMILERTDMLVQPSAPVSR